MKEEILAHYFVNTMKANQDEAELAELIKILKKEKIKNVLEIGVERAGTLKLFQELGARVVVGIDINPVDLIKDTILITGDSHNEKTVDEVKELKIEFDFLFIDGDHSYNGIKQDFENYSKFVRSGGIIGFHDIRGEAEKFWNEIKGERYKEIYNTENTMGIGLIRMSIYKQKNEKNIEVEK